MSTSDTNAKTIRISSRSREFTFGIGTALAALLFGALVIPTAVEAPDSVEHLPLSPRFLPYVITGLIIIFSSLHALEALKAPRLSTSSQNKEAPECHPHWKLRVSIICLCLFGYFYLSEYIGMLSVSILSTAGLMLLGGERSPIALIGCALVLPVLVFLFFIRVAQVPIPLGFFE